MKFSTNIIIFLSYASIAFGVPAVAPLEKRQAGTPTLTPGSTITVGTNPPTYSPTAAIGGVSLSSNFQWQIYKSCPNADRATINTAWADSKRLSDAWASYVPHGAYQDTVNMYMGTRSTYSSIGNPGFDFPKQISVKTQQEPTKTVSPSKNPNPSSGPAPYATGTCSFHLVETQDCAEMTSNLFAIVTLYDNKKNVIGQTPTDGDNSIGKPINVKDPYSFDSKLPQVIVITGEHENDYVQFAYGSLQWTSRTTNGAATCSNGGWDPRDGPICDQRWENQNAVNQMDCSFPC